MENVAPKGMKQPNVGGGFARELTLNGGGGGVRREGGDRRW